MYYIMAYPKEEIQAMKMKNEEENKEKREWCRNKCTENKGMDCGMEIEGEWGKIIERVIRSIAVKGNGWYVYS